MNAEQEINLRLHGLTHDGRGVGRHEGLAVFVEGGLPGQTVSCRLTNQKKNLAEASLIAVLENSPDERQNPCRHAQDCGGCPLQALKYPAQLVWKTQLVQDAILRIGHLHLPENCFLPIQTLSAQDASEWGYRNKMEFTFAQDEQGKTQLGLLGRHSHRVVEVTDCLLQTPRTMRILADIRQLTDQHGLTAYTAPGASSNTNKHLRQTSEAGILRFAIIREPRLGKEQAETSQCQVELITAPPSKEQTAKLVALGKDLLAKAKVSGFVHSVRISQAAVAYGEKIILRLGRVNLSESLLLGEHPTWVTYELGAQSFFQVNTAMAEKLYNTAISWVRNYTAQSGEARTTCFDLYCGVGGLGLALAPLFSTVLGLDNNRLAIELARKNARAFPNCKFETAEADQLAKVFKLSGTPDLLCADPPRKGLEKEAAMAILRRLPRHLLLISCNPPSLARDLALLAEQYEIKAIQPFDLFPQTPHVETLVWLTLRQPQKSST